jgi:Cof subfamily protein (haloacid dehalogenase superfamily)
MYRLVAIDVDGTLLNSAHKLSQGNELALRELVDRGIHVVIATGKPYVSIAGLVAHLRLTSPQITSEAAIVTDPVTGKILKRTGVPFDLASQVVDISMELNATLVISAGDKIFAREINEDIEYLLTYGDPVPELMNDLREALQPLPTHLMLITYRKDALFLSAEERFRRELGAKLRIHRSVPYYLNFVNRDVSKGKTLQEVCQLLDVDIKETLVIGDSENDLTMFEVAGCAVAMGNSPERIKEQAHYVTDTNDQDGVAHAIHHLILS